MEQTSPKITPINRMREKCMNALTDEAIAIYNRIFPVVKDPVAAQDLTTSILIGMEHTVPLHTYNFDDRATDPYVRNPAETAIGPIVNGDPATGKRGKAKCPERKDARGNSQGGQGKGRRSGKPGAEERDGTPRLPARDGPDSQGAGEIGGIR